MAFIETAGFHSNDGTAMAMWGCKNPNARFGVGIASKEEKPFDAGRDAALMAQKSANMRGNDEPSLVLLIGSPGHEEDVLEGIKSVFGRHVQLLGASSADNSVEGKWFQFCGTQITYDGVVVVAIATPDLVETVFDCGYAPSAHKGIVTKCSASRIVEQIDGQPAAEVYDQWTGGAISKVLLSGSGGNILTSTTLHPLGRQVDDRYELLHPDSVTSTKGLSMFADIKEKQEIVLMAGTKDSLLNNISNVQTALQTTASFAEEDILGGLVMYCGGCVLALEERKTEVAAAFKACMGDKPFIGVHPFGEQVKIILSLL